MAKRIIIIFVLAAMIMLIAAGAFILQGNNRSEVSQNCEADTSINSTTVCINEVIM